MSLNDLLPELLKLTPEEMLQAIAILQKRIADEQPTNPVSRGGLEVWSPQIAPETARELLEMLQEDAEHHG